MEKETKWYDAWIRWERGSKETYNEESDDDDDEDPPIPTDTYSFAYDNNTIHIDLKGFPAESEAIWSSTGLTIWRSSEYLCDYLVENKEELFTQNSSVLELGSGLGKSGILAHFLAQDKNCNILLTDGDTDTLSQLRDNVRLNLLGEKIKNKNTSCHQLLWGKDTAKDFQKKHHHGSFHLIMGSDLVYVPNVIEPLFETVQALLALDGIFVMAHCSRRQGNEVTLDMVLNAADRSGFHHHLIKEEDDDDILLYKFQWKRK